MSAYTAIGSMEFNDLDREIKRAMRRSAKDAVRLGYMLRRMMEKKLWETAFGCFDEYLEKELHMEYSMANRFMNINRKFSVHGNSMDIAGEYEGYSQGLLIEMLSMAPELKAEITPDMTVKQVREIKRRARREKKAPVQLPEEGKETIIDGEYREIRGPEEESNATSQPKKEKAHDESWFVGQYARILPGAAAELFEICRKEQNDSDRAKAVHKHIAPYGYNGYNGPGWDFTFHGFAAGMDIRIGSEKMHLKYGRFVVELMKLQDKEVAMSQPGKEEKLSAYGLPKTVYPEGSLLTTVGCGHKHDCSSCAQDCSIRQESRYCRLAPMGSPFGCTTMEVLENLKEERGGKCQFIDNSLAYHTVGSNEADPCCKDCKELCGYRCQRSQQPHNTETENRDVESEEEYVPEGRLQVLKHLLDQKKGALDFYSKAGCLSETDIRRDRSIVEALADMVRDLEDTDHVSGLEEITQPELPALKNNGQRKEWLRNYKGWGLWYRDENIDVNYYKYDFDDGSRLVVAEYPQRYRYWNAERKDEYYFHLLEKDKEGCNGKTYDEQYRNQTDSETYLVEFLKNLQKG